MSPQFGSRQTGSRQTGSRQTGSPQNGARQIGPFGPGPEADGGGRSIASEDNGRVTDSHLPPFDAAYRAGVLTPVAFGAIRVLGWLSERDPSQVANETFQSVQHYLSSGLNEALIRVFFDPGCRDLRGACRRLEEAVRKHIAWALEFVREPEPAFVSRLRGPDGDAALQMLVDRARKEIDGLEPWHLAELRHEVREVAKDWEDAREEARLIVTGLHSGPAAGTRPRGPQSAYFDSVLQLARTLVGIERTIGHETFVRIAHNLRQELTRSVSPKERDEVDEERRFATELRDQLRAATVDQADANFPGPRGGAIVFTQLTPSIALLDLPHEDDRVVAAARDLGQRIVHLGYVGDDLEELSTRLKAVKAAGGLAILEAIPAGQTSGIKETLEICEKILTVAERRAGDRGTVVRIGRIIAGIADPFERLQALHWFQTEKAEEWLPFFEAVKVDPAARLVELLSSGGAWNSSAEPAERLAALKDLPTTPGRALSIDVLLQYRDELVLSPPLFHWAVGSSRVDLQACKLEYSIVSPK